MVKPPTFAKMAPRYANMWARMEIDPKKLKIVDATAREIIEKRKTRYLKVEAATGVPWWWIAVAHHREASGSFAGVLHNGDRIIGTGRTTYRVPKGRGPFATWEEAAIDALKMPGKELHKIKDWTLERAAYQLEAFNGWGYFWKGIPSSYLWSFSNIARPGKYVADHVWDSNAVDGQMGVMPLLQRLQALDASVVFGSEPKADPKPPMTPAEGTAAGSAGAATGTAAAAAGLPIWAVVLIGLAVAIAVAGIIIWKRRK